MRADAANLLARLNRTDFRYREFNDAFADMELWPIFEALLTDENVVGKPLSVLAAKEAAEAVPKPAPARPEASVERAPEPPRPTTRRSDPPGSIFAPYGGADVPAKGDLRGFLSRLSSHHEGDR